MTISIDSAVCRILRCSEEDLAMRLHGLLFTEELMNECMKSLGSNCRVTTMQRMKEILHRPTGKEHKAAKAEVRRLRTAVKALSALLEAQPRKSIP